MAREFLHAVDDILEAIAGIDDADEVKATQSDIPWPSIRAIGNVLRHEYQGLSDQIIWNVVVDELPKLKEALTQICNNFDTARRPE